MTGRSLLELLQLAAWGLIPLAGLWAWRLVKGARRVRPLGGVVLLGLGTLIYAHFVEPRVLLVREHRIVLDGCASEDRQLRLALIADLHVGVFRNTMSMHRIRDALRRADADVVLIAGDFVYHLDPSRFDEAFSPLSEVGVPVLFVLGNHDVGLPGTNVERPLEASLERLGLVNATHRSVTVPSRRGRFVVVGISDQWQGRQRFDEVMTATAATRIVLTHHPETILRIPEGSQVDLLVAGHTHGGQIWIPGLTCRLASFACIVTLEGTFRRPQGQGFVTAGTGMVGLPLRLAVPPRIDILNVEASACP